MVTHSEEVLQTEIIQDGDWLTVTFDQPHRVLSWAIVNGGISQTNRIAWLKVGEGSLGGGIDPKIYFNDRLNENGLQGAVGLLTSADLESYSDVYKQCEDISARCIATVSMGNALRVGDQPYESGHVGTINLAVQMSVPLTDEALIEAMSIAAEARTAAVMDAACPSIRSGLTATGTGTDCIVVAVPVAGEPIKYTGMHTAAGHLIGSTVYEAISDGIKKWKQRHG